MTRRSAFSILAALIPVVAVAEPVDCVIDPAVVVSVGSPVTGLLESVLISRGQRVARGEVIARLRADVEDATIALIAVQAENAEEIAASQARLDLALRRQARTAELKRRGVATGEELDEVNAAVDVATRELALAGMRNEVVKLELERARTTRELRVIRSPIDGIVVQRLKFDGEFMNQDASVAMIAQLDPLHVEVYLPVDMYPEVQNGQFAEVRPDEPIGGAYMAEVTVVDRVFDPASGTFGVRLALPNPGGKLPAGQRCEVDFDVGG